MKNEFNLVELDYLQKLNELCSFVPKDPLLRSEFLFNIRRLASLKITAGEDEERTTALELKLVQSERYNLLRNLSSLGSESLLEYYQKGENYVIQEKKS